MAMVSRDFTIVPWSHHMRRFAVSAVEIRCRRRAGSVGERRLPNRRAGLDLIGCRNPRVHRLCTRMSGPIILGPRSGLISVGSFRA
jgi:hypothetical protein